MMRKLLLSLYLSPLSVGLIFVANYLTAEPVVGQTHYSSSKAKEATKKPSSPPHKQKLACHTHPLLLPRANPQETDFRPDIAFATHQLNQKRWLQETTPMSESARDYARDKPMASPECVGKPSVESAQLSPSPFAPTINAQVSPVDPLEQPPSLTPLPETEPQPLPPPEELIPPSQDPDTPETPPGELPDGIVVERFEIKGSTVFSQEQIAQVTAPFLNRPLSFAELLQVRSAITKLYQDNGYINSGAFIPPQEVADGIVVIEVLEGGVEEINVEVDGRLRSSYVGSRLALATKNPLNINQLVEALQMLRLDPLIDNISSELSASPTPGSSILDVQVTTADTFELRTFFNNGRSPSVGTFRRGAGFTEANLLGFGDSLSFDYSNTDGSDSFDVSYTFPINARNGSLRFAYGTTSSEVIEDPFDELDIDSESRYYEFTYRQPIVQTPNEEFVLGLTFSRQESETSILDIGFPLSAGADDDGDTRISAVRFFQEWLNRNEQQVLAARSQFSFGVDWFDATDNSGEVPDSTFLAWRLQGQWVRLLAQDTLLLLRTDLQLANDALPPLEQFRIGGMDSVRGYRQDLLLTDNGWFVSAEARLPILRIPEWELLLQVTPFIDYGRGWNFFGGNPEDNAIGAGGLGLRLQVADYLTARLEWGIPWVDVNSSDRTLQEQGIHFSILFTPF